MIDLLSEIAVFQALPFDGLSTLAARGRPRSFPAGSELMRQGDVGDVVYVIAKGLVLVERAHPHVVEPLVIAELGRGAIVGEMGVLDGEPRSATVTAIEDTEALELDAATLGRTVLQYPEGSSALLRTLSRRLRSADELATQLALASEP